MQGSFAALGCSPSIWINNSGASTVNLPNWHRTFGVDGQRRLRAVGHLLVQPFVEPLRGYSIGVSGQFLASTRLQALAA